MMMIGWMNFSFIDFLNICEVNVDLLLGIIICGNLDFEKFWYRVVFVEVEVLGEGSYNK